MSSIEVIWGRGHEPINPAEFAYVLDDVNGRLDAILREQEREEAQR